MKWIFLILIVGICWIGYVQHTHNQQSIKETTKELLEENGYSKVVIEGINLPISYTFFSQKVVSEVFIKNINGGSIEVTVTPIEGYPIVSIFVPPLYQIEFDPYVNLREIFKYFLTD
jgi:hypothetical protein